MALLMMNDSDNDDVDEPIIMIMMMAGNVVDNPFSGNHSTATSLL